MARLNSAADAAVGPSAAADHLAQRAASQLRLLVLERLLSRLQHEHLAAVAPAAPIRAARCTAIPWRRSPSAPPHRWMPIRTRSSPPLRPGVRREPPLHLRRRDRLPRSAKDNEEGIALRVDHLAALRGDRATEKPLVPCQHAAILLRSCFSSRVDLSTPVNRNATMPHG